MSMSDASRIEQQRANPRIANLWKAMRPLGSVASFLNTGAHPDDETTAMITALAFRDGFRIAFACANRGEGGQNNIGTQRGADLGALRTREMERACDEIGMGLYWLSETPDDPIFDFGFSKSGEETFRYWGRERTVERMVQIIRQERPDIICPTFLDVPGQHGHHRAMTQVAREAIDIAADAAAWPEQLRNGIVPWQVSKFYLPAWSGGGRSYDDTEPPPKATIAIPSGTDPVLGATYEQIGEWSRSHHKTQGMGQWIEAGPKSWPLHRGFAAANMPAEEIYANDGLPKTVADLAELAETDGMGRLLVAASGAIEATLTVWPDFDAIARTGAVAHNAVHAARGLLSASEEAGFGHRLARKERQLARVVAIAAGVEATLVPVTAVAVPGGIVDISLELVPGGSVVERRPTVDLKTPDGWRATRTETGFELAVPVDAALCDPYPPRYEPSGEQSPITGNVTFTIGDNEISACLPLARPVHVLPTQSVQLEPQCLVVNTAAATQSRVISIHIENNAGAETAGSLAITRAGGWAVKLGPKSATKTDISGRSTIAASLDRKSEAKSGLAELKLTIDGENAEILSRMEHTHTGKVFRAAPAILRVLTLKAELPADLRIAYIGSSNDTIDENLRTLGADVETLGQDEFADADLADFDTIVVGILALGARNDLVARLPLIHQWVRGGGNLVTLYHRPWDNWNARTTPPAYLEIGQPSLRWRVTDANAKVKILRPKHQLLTGPNKIVAADWAAWEKERGLYFAKAWDDTYEALISMADPNEAPHEGALLSAKIGKGRHTHCSLILHHQMERMVPGGFRIMANLVSGGRG